MNKNLLSIIIAVVLIGFGVVLVNGNLFKKIDASGIILFYGDGCPHCKIVDDFISQNKIEDKVKFTRLEVWYNKNNQKVIQQVAQKCGINANSIGVPFLFDGISKCYVGDVDTINFFKNEAGIQ